MNYLFVALSSNENELGTGHFVRTRKLFDTFSEKNLNNSYFLSNVNQGIKLSNNKVFFEQNLTSKLLEKYLTNLEIDVMFVDACSILLVIIFLLSLINDFIIVLFDSDAPEFIIQ